jgi:hypothetical protein
MSRFTMALAASGASAVAAIAVVALPAVGAGPKPSRQQAQPGADFTTFVSCLRSHGLAGAPTDPAQLKPWLGARETSDPDAVKAAMAACDDKQPDGRHGADEKRVVVRGPDIEELIACVRSHGLDAPTAPDAFKRWVADKEASDPGALDNAIRDCKMSLDPGAAEGPAKPGACGDEVRPADKAAKRQDAAKQHDAANQQAT